MTFIRLQPSPVSQAFSNQTFYGPRQFRRFLAEAASGFNENACGPKLEYQAGPYTPRMDVFEDENAYQFVAELPGVKAEDVKATISEGLLTIKGEKKRSEAEQTNNFHRTERRFGEFVRQFTLPEDAGEDVTANFVDGVLKITIAKVKLEKPSEREIKIGVN